MQGESPHQTISKGAIVWSPYLGGDTLVLQVCELVKSSQESVWLLHQPGKVKWKWKLLSRVWLFPTPWIIQSMGFSRSEYQPGKLPYKCGAPWWPSGRVDTLPNSRRIPFISQSNWTELPRFVQCGAWATAHHSPVFSLQQVSTLACCWMPGWDLTV